MPSFQFWKSWHKTDQVIFWFCAVFVSLTIIFFWQSWSVSPAPVITYEHFQHVQEVESTTHSFTIGLINVAVPAYSEVIFESIFGSPLQPNALAADLFLTALALSFVFFISIISSLSRFWFLIGMGLVILFLASLRLEAVEVFGLTNKTVAVGLVFLYGGLAYYLNAWKKNTSFIQRILSFLVLTLAVGLIVNFFSKAHAPFLHVSVNGLITGMILTVLFIMMVAHEIIAAFVTITTQSQKSSKSLQHFLVLVLVYLVNLALMFASKIGMISWDFFTVNAFLILTISAILGIWGFRQRIFIYDHILPSEPLGIFFFFSMMITAFATLGYFFSSASDMMIDAFEDLIMAVHLGVGIIFILYVIANFGPMLVKNLPVYRVLYKPEIMPHFTLRIMSVIAAFGVLSLGVSWKTYVNQAAASYYHAYADLFLSQGDVATAEVYYQKSVQLRNQNLHAHYALASLYRARYESFKERKEYENSKDWTPSVPVFLNLSEAFANHGDLLEAALTLDEGKKKFPKSGELQNAAGLSFLKLKSIDSALYFFQQTENLSQTKSVGETNYLGTAALYKINLPVDTLISFDEAKQSGKKVNVVALANVQQRTIKFEGNFIPDSALSIYQTSLLCNYFINQKENSDTALINRSLVLAQKPVNDNFKTQLLIASAHALYAHGHVKKALEVAREAAFLAGDGKLFSLIGLWLLEQNNPVVATAYLKTAAEKQQPFALYYLALAQQESDSLTQAFGSWDSLSRAKNTNTVAFATMMKKVLLSNPTQAMNLTDEEKYYFCRYKIALSDSATYKKFSSSISNPAIRAQAQLDRAKKWFALDEPGKALFLLHQMGEYNNRKIRNEFDRLNFMIACSNQDWVFVQKTMSEKNTLSRNEKTYAEALLAAHNGNLKMARGKYEYLLQANNQFEEGLVAASQFFAKDSTDRLKNFSLLVDGLLAKPNSVKILKQHILESIALGFDTEAQDSLNKLRQLLPDDSFKKFIVGHPGFFSVEK